MRSIFQGEIRRGNRLEVKNNFGLGDESKGENFARGQSVRRHLKKVWSLSANFQEKVFEEMFYLYFDIFKWENL